MDHGPKRHSIQAEYAKGIEVVSQELLKGQTLPWKVQGLNTTDLLRQPSFCKGPSNKYFWFC